jgi:hypothetical protein
MGNGHAERNLALIRQLEAETRKLLETLDQPGPKQPAWVQETTSPKDSRFTAGHIRPSIDPSKAAQASKRLTALAWSPRRIPTGSFESCADLLRPDAGPSPARSLLYVYRRHLLASGSGLASTDPGFTLASQTARRRSRKEREYLPCSNRRPLH